MPPLTIADLLDENGHYIPRYALLETGSIVRYRGPSLVLDGVNLVVLPGTTERAARVARLDGEPLPEGLWTLPRHHLHPTGKRTQLPPVESVHDIIDIYGDGTEDITYTNGSPTAVTVSAARYAELLEQARWGAR